MALCSGCTTTKYQEPVQDLEIIELKTIKTIELE